MQLFNKVKNFRLGKAKAFTKHPPSKVGSTCQTDQQTASPKQINNQADSISITSSRWTELCTRSDEWSKAPSSNLPSPGSMSIVRTVYVDNLLYHTAKLHEHHWKLLGGQEKYNNCKFLDDVPPKHVIRII